METKNFKNSLRINLQHDRIFFIGDLHFGHGNAFNTNGIIEHDNRPFININDHDNSLINNWNEVVGKNDIVFLIGDISFSSFKKTNLILNQLNGIIYLICGNHDKIKNLNQYENIKEVYSILDLYIIDDTALDGLTTQQHLVLCHFPILSWNRNKYNSFHIHAHCHHNLVNNDEYDWYYKKLVIDVGCNGINYKPISYKEIKKIMLNKTNI